MRNSRVILLAFLGCGYGVAGFENKFLFPTEDGLTFYYMNTIEVKYQSNYSDPILYTFCKQGNGDAQLKDKSSAPGNNGTVSVKLDFTKADRCWFNLRSEVKKNNLGINSPNEWKFEADEKNTTTVKAPDTTKAPSTTTVTSTSSIASATSTIGTTTTAVAGEAVTPTQILSATGTPVPEDTGTSAAKIGIGVGIAFAGLLVMTAIGMVASRVLRKRRSTAEHSVPSQTSYVGAQASAVSYNPVSQFEPGGTTRSNPFTPHYR